MLKQALLLALLAILLISSFSVSVPMVHADLTSGTLADAMNAIITANNWDPASWFASQPSGGTVAYVPHYATVFSVGSPSYYETAAQDELSMGNWPVCILFMKQLAIDDGMPSAVSDTTLDSYLSSATMTGYLPITYLEEYCDESARFEANAYDWAPSSLTSKWDKAGAINEINSIIVAGGSSNPRTYIAYSTSGGFDTYHRYYDDTATSIEWLEQMGGPMSTCDMIWNFQQTFFWNGLYYGYNGQATMETEDGFFALLSGRYLVTEGLFNTYVNRLISDMNQKLLINGYNSPLWNPGFYTLDHVPGRGESRLQNTEGAWAAMQAYYLYMTPTMQAKFRSMGSVGWKGLLDDSGDFYPASNEFAWGLPANGGTPSLAATGAGLMIMFYNGIVPGTGSLAIPLTDETYEDTCSNNPATMFNFNYNARTIMIPVDAGQINFTFGSGTASYTFPQTGVYVVHFSDDWNTVTSASYSGPLDPQFKYVPITNTPPPTTATLQVDAQTTQSDALNGVPVTLAGVEIENTPATWTLNLGTYSLSVPQTFSGYTFQQWSDATTSTSRTIDLQSATTLTAVYSATSPPPPAYYPSSLGETSTLAGRNSTFYCDWFPSTTLSGFMLSDNNTGTMVNETWTSFSSLGSGNSWSNFTLTLNSSAVTIQWLFYANDTGNNWNDPMPFQYLTIRLAIHDIAVTNVVPAKTIVGQGFPLNISVTVANLGDYRETVNVTTYANMTPVGPPSSIDVASGDSSVVIFAWNTSGFDEGNYVMSAYAEPVPNETDLSNNNYTDGVVTVAVHDIAVTGITFSDEQPSVNDTVTVYVTVQNNGANTENFTVSVNCTLVNETVIGTEPLTLAPEETATLNFTWTPADVGLYTITAYTSEIVGDPTPDDNTRIAYLFISSPHDVAVTDVECGKTVVFQGYNCSDIDVMVANVGDFAEVFNVTVYVNMTTNANVTSIDAFSNISLNSGNSVTLISDWNTTGFSKGNYTIMAYAWPVPGDTDTVNNNFTGGWVVISMVGDLTGSSANVWDFVPDGKVDGKDVSVVAKCFGSYVGCSPPLVYNVNCDLFDRGKIDGKDIATVARQFGEYTA
jgi:hypothetical protein